MMFVALFPALVALALLVAALRVRPGKNSAIKRAPPLSPTLIR
jgi:hypothetical protein